MKALRRRWDALSPLARRAIFAAILVVVVLLLSGFQISGLMLGLVFAAIYVPPWQRVPYVGRYIPTVAAIALLVAYPYYVGKMFQFPIFGPFPTMDTATIAVIFAMMAVGLNIVVGYAGLLDLGYVAFYAMGAYTVAWFASPHFAEQSIFFGAVGVSPDIPGIHVSVWLLLVLAGVITAVIGVLIGLPTLRLRGDYLAIVTLGFGEIMPQVARNGDNFLGTGFDLTGGPPGITPIDAPGFGSWAAQNVCLPEFISKRCLPDNYIASTSFDKLFFWTGIVLLLFTVFCSARLRDSRLGRAWVAIREDETAAAAMGVPLMRTKTWAYAAGAFFGGIAGAYYASYKTATFPDDFFFNISIFILCMVILGGMGNIWGVLIGAFFLSYLDREGLANIGTWINERFSGDAARWTEVFQNPIDIPLYSFGIYGLVILIVMLFRPEGLIPSSRRKAEFDTGDVHDEPLYDVTR